MSITIDSEKKKRFIEFSKILKKAARTGEVRNVDVIRIAMDTLHILIDAVDREESTLLLEEAWEVLLRESALEVNKSMLQIKLS